MQFSFKCLFYFYAIPVLSLMIICLPSQAQHRSGGMNADGNLLGGSKRGSGGGGYIPTEGWAVALSGGYEAPLGDLKLLYKSAPTFGVTVSKRINNLLFSANIDYRTFQPKETSYPIEVDFLGQTTTVGTLAFSSFKAATVSVGAAYQLLITPGSAFYFGANAGYMISNHVITVDDFQQPESQTVNSKIPYISPKIGLNFAVNNAISLGLEGYYGLSVVKSNSDFLSTTEAPTDNVKFAGGKLSLTYSF